MKRKLLPIVVLSGLIISGCSNNQEDSVISSNSESSVSKDSSTTISSSSTSNISSTTNSESSSTNSSIDYQIPSEIVYEENKQAIEEAINVDVEEIKQQIDASDATTLADTGTIENEGSYILSGQYSNGITIQASKDATIHLFLNNANISNASGAAIIKSDNKINLIITAMEGTTNYISTTCNEENALHVKGSLAINGTGTINIESSEEDSSGIKVSKTCTIVDATINISTSKHGISAETIIASDATISITGLESSKDGLHSECDFDNKKGTTYDFTLESGYVILKNTNYSCLVYGDGIQADTFTYIDGGTYNIKTIGTFISYSAENLELYDLEDDDFRYIKSNNTYKKVASDYNGNINSRYALAQSTKGIKVGEISYDTDGDDVDDVEILDNCNYAIYIQSGTFTIDSTDDAIHCNSGSTFIENGNFTIDTYDDGITSDYLSYINDGTINIQSSYEGIEGAYVIINNGNITINSSDDAINAASDDTNINEYIIINGGTIEVNADGDGIDSNGNIIMNGGNVTVFGPTSGADSALDFDNECLIYGGTLFATSSIGMLEKPSTKSSQNVVIYTQNSQISSNSTVYLKDENENVLLTFKVNKACQAIILSSSLLKTNQSYSLYLDSTLLSSFSISSTITSIGTSQGGFPGGNPGGQPPHK